MLPGALNEENFATHSSNFGTLISILGFFFFPLSSSLTSIIVTIRTGNIGVVLKVQCN